MATDIEPKEASAGVAPQNHDTIEEKGGLGSDDQHVEVLKNQDAYDGENREHAQGTWEAFKSHPWACFWAFLMCFTIVSLLRTLGGHPSRMAQHKLTPLRP